MRVFIDTNIFLSFYHLTSEDLEELKKLTVLIKNKEIDLLLPQQVIDETWRNRASKLNDSLKDFKKLKFAFTYPAYCKDYDQYVAMKEIQKQLEKLHSEMLEQIQSDVDGHKLAADVLLQDLFDTANRIERTQDLILAAKERIELGNPPGKKGSLGDAVNWETLIRSVPNEVDIILIADDADFYSPLDTNKIDEFLEMEWKEKKKSNLISYRKLSYFFKDHFPDINLQAELDKDGLINQLSVSATFSTTHILIARLSKYDGFTHKQAEDLFDALLVNDQVRLIITDDDVHTFYEGIYEKYGQVKPEFAEKIGGLLA